MKVMVVGGGGREHALAWKIAKSPLCEKLYLAPGNPLSGELGERVFIPVNDIVALRVFAEKNEIDLTVVGPELPLVHGITDEFEKAGLKVFGPSRAAARLEGSKFFSKEIMRKHLIPTAAFSRARSLDEAHSILEDMEVPVVIKADGLAEGKGAFVCKTETDVKNALKEIFIDKRFGDSGLPCVIEEFLQGEEASLFVITDGNTILPLMPAQDHKAVNEGDTGPNTGGMGSYLPAPLMNEDTLNKTIREIVVPTVHAMNAEGCPYRGLLYVGLMVNGGHPKVVEYNCRFGDPETQPMMMQMKSDILPIFDQVAKGKLDSDREIEWHDGASIGVVLASGGYPGSYAKGKAITGLKDLPDDVVAFAAGVGGTAQEPVTSGGRVLCLTARGANLKEAADRVYSSIDKVRFDGAFYRRDIGHRALD